MAEIDRGDIQKSIDQFIFIDFGTGNLDDTIYLIEKLKHTQKGDYTHRILWASDAPVGEFNQIPDLYKNNLENFKEKIQTI